jgi:hypothetical protein
MVDHQDDMQEKGRNLNYIRSDMTKESYDEEERDGSWQNPDSQDQLHQNQHSQHYPAEFYVYEVSILVLITRTPHSDLRLSLSEQKIYVRRLPSVWKILRLETM